MNNLHRELAPVSDAAWAQIEQEVARTFRRNLAGRRVVDVKVAESGRECSAIGTGHLKALKAPQLATQAFMVEGHTDAAGTPGYNLNLSQRRAQAVVRYLGQHGVEASRLIAKGYGQSRPVVADPLSGDNRRVETRLRTE